MMRVEQNPRSIVAVRDLSKSYGDVEALRNVSFDVAAGRIVGLLGHNGAGKTTTLEVVSGLCGPDRGDVRVLGLDVATHRREVQRRIGYSPQGICLHPLLTVRELVGVMARLRDASIQTVLAGDSFVTLRIAPLLDRQASKLSGGEQRRVQLALALAHEPELVLLDEPTAGVDVWSRRAIQRLLAELARAGRTVVYSTHYLEEAQECCEDVVILDRGRVVSAGASEDLRARLGLGSVTVRSDGPIPGAVSEILETRSDVWSVETNDAVMRIQTRTPQTVLTPTLDECGRIGLRVLEVDLRSPTLESAFLGVASEGEGL